MGRASGAGQLSLCAVVSAFMCVCVRVSACMCVCACVRAHIVLSPDSSMSSMALSTDSVFGQS